MNKEKAEKILEIVQAIIDGKQIQSLQGDTQNQWWTDDNDPNLNMPDLLRVKPEPRCIELKRYQRLIAQTENGAVTTREVIADGPCKFIEVLDD